jgi:dihydroflavonol-4-reductase
MSEQGASGVAAVSGATGFIGSAVIRRLLDAGRSVRALVERGAPRDNLVALGHRGAALEIIEVDVCDYVGMARALDGASAYYHLAAIYKVWLRDPSVIYRVNIEGTTTSLLAARAANVPKIVYTSSIAAVGLRDSGEPSDETDAFNLHAIANEYLLTKHLSERIALRFAETMPIVVVNPAFPFGAGDVAPTPTGKIVLALLKGEVPGVSAGGFCAIDVDDVAAGHVAAETKGRVGERYILGNHNVELGAFFNVVAKVAGVRAPRLPIPSALGQAIGFGLELWADHVSHEEPRGTYKAIRYMQRKAFFDVSKARRELGLPCTPLEDSVERAVRWFKDRGMA